MTSAAEPGDARRQFGQALAGAAVALGLAMSELQHGLLLDFIDLLHRWNASYNLTSIRDKGSMLDSHVIDCLAAVTPFRRELARLRKTDVLDAGSGGGLPGVVLAIMQPDSEVTCVDSVGKKAAFIRQVAATLRLQNLQARHARVETLKNHSFAVVTSRAFSSLADFVRLTGGAIEEEGAWMAMKGKTPEHEIEALPKSVRVFHVEHLNVPRQDGDRCLVWIQKTHDE